MEEMLAEILVRSSLKVTPFDVVVVDYQDHAGGLFNVATFINLSSIRVV